MEIYELTKHIDALHKQLELKNILLEKAQKAAVKAELALKDPDYIYGGERICRAALLKREEFEDEERKRAEVAEKKLSKLLAAINKGIGLVDGYCVCGGVTHQCSSRSDTLLRMYRDEFELKVSFIHRDVHFPEDKPDRK